MRGVAAYRRRSPPLLSALSSLFPLPATPAVVGLNAFAELNNAIVAADQIRQFGPHEVGVEDTDDDSSLDVFGDVFGLNDASMVSDSETTVEEVFDFLNGPGDESTSNMPDNLSSVLPGAFARRGACVRQLFADPPAAPFPPTLAVR